MSSTYDPRYFTEAEFACKCGCGKNYVDPALVIKLDLMRGHLNIPLIVHSASRCSKHNEAVGGSPTSSHLTGHAVDIRALSHTTRLNIIAAAILFGIERIGVGKTYVHLDNDPTKPKALWPY